MRIMNGYSPDVTIARVICHARALLRLCPGCTMQEHKLTSSQSLTCERVRWPCASTRLLWLLSRLRTRRPTPKSRTGCKTLPRRHFPPATTGEVELHDEMQSLSRHRLNEMRAAGVRFAKRHEGTDCRRPRRKLTLLLD